MRTNFIWLSHSTALAPTLVAIAMCLQLTTLAQPDPQWKIHDSTRPKPPIVDPGTPSTDALPGRPPSDAVVLFDGKDLSQWVSLDGSPAKWIVKDGHLECVKDSGYIRSLQAFGDCQLHVEWAAPLPAQGKSQGRGNSGVFLMGIYEVQVLDSYGNETYPDGQACAIYCQSPPLVNPSRPPGQWQTYDVIFTRPRFDDQGKLLAPARMTILYNGLLVQHDVALTGPTGWLKRRPYSAHPDKLPISLQDHGNPVLFRNIWVRELGPDARQKEFNFNPALWDKYIGTYEARPDFHIYISRQGNQLLAVLNETTPERSFHVFAESKTKFFTRSTDLKLEFATNDQGLVEGLTWWVGGDEYKAKKIQ
jgi:hypothetical protein